MYIKAILMPKRRSARTKRKYSAEVLFRRFLIAVLARQETVRESMGIRTTRLQ